MLLLDAEATVDAVTGLLNAGGPVLAVVAYWGNGATEALGINNGQNLTIICNLLSGGCNPTEIRTLRERLGVGQVLTHDRLHAKVWLGDAAAVLGSSNASSNGMGFEGGQVTSLVEANVRLDARSSLAELRIWAEGVTAEARQITIQDLNQADLLHKRYRSVRPLPPGTQNLLTGLIENPEAFAGLNLYVWVYNDRDLDEWAENALTAAQTQFHDDGLSCYQDVENPPPPGSVVIDFDSNQDPPRYNGMWKIIDSPIDTAEGSILPCKYVNNFRGLRLGPRAPWRAAAAIAAPQNDGDTDGWEADVFARSFLRRPNQ